MLTNMAFSLLTCISDNVNLSTIGCWGVNRLLGELLLVCLVYLILVRRHIDQVLVTWAGQRCSAVILIRISQFRVKCKCILYTRMYFTYVCTLRTLYRTKEKSIIEQILINGNIFKNFLITIKSNCKFSVRTSRYIK